MIKICDNSVKILVFFVFRIKEVVCFGEGAGANILARFAVSKKKKPHV